MAARVVGALLAFVTAALLAVSVIVTPWWAGHPTFNGATIKAKEITIGPLGAIGCNTGGDGACMSIPVDPTFETLGFALTGVAGLLAVLALVLAIATFKGAARAKSLAIFVIVGAMIAAALAMVLVVIGPRVRTEAPLPFAFGLYIFLGSIASAIVGCTLAMRAQPPPRPRLRPVAPRPSMQHAQPAAPSPLGGLDVQALLADDVLRPSSLGPEPKIGRGSPVQSPGGALPGPSGPLGAIGGGPQPLFSSAPNLRPLYEANPAQGGTAGFVPQQPAQTFPIRPPTPVPRDQISAMAGIPTPASIAAERPVTFSAGGAPPPPPPGPSLETDRDLLGSVRGVGRPKDAAKPATLPPPLEAAPTPSPQPRTTKAATLPPPPARGAKIRESLKASSIAAIPSLAQRPLVPMPAKHPTLATAAVPPPPNPTLAAPPPLDDDGEAFDAMKTYQHEPSRRPSRPSGQQPVPRPSTPRPPTRLTTATEDMPVDTDVAHSIDEHVQTESFETSTNESTSFAPPPVRRPTQPPVTSTMEMPAAPPATSDDDDPLGASMPKQPTDIDLPAVRPPTETAPSPSAPAHTPAPVVIAPGVEEGPTDREKAKLPISTAPDSLPPPSEKQAATSGPSPACPQCEAPMAWVEAHLRFYCKSCKMYF